MIGQFVLLHLGSTCKVLVNGRKQTIHTQTSARTIRQGTHSHAARSMVMRVWKWRVNTLLPTLLCNVFVSQRILKHEIT